MSYLEEHVFADIEFEIPLTDIDGEFQQLIVDTSGTFDIRFPGKLFLLRDARHLTVFDPIEVPEVPTTVVGEEFANLLPIQQDAFQHERAQLLFEADVFWATEAVDMEERNSWLSWYRPC